MSSENDSDSETSSIDGAIDDHSNGGQGHGDEPSPLKELVRILIPHLLDQSKSTEVRDKLKNLGLKTISDIKDVEPQDVKEYIPAIPFRQVRKKILSDLTSRGKKNKNPGKYTYNEKVFPKKLRSLMKRPVILKPKLRQRALRLLAEDMSDNIDGTLQSSVVQEVAAKLLHSYGGAFGCVVNDALERQEAIFNLSNSLTTRFYYCKGETDPAKQKKKRRFSVYQEAGLLPERDLPTQFPIGETVATLEAKRLSMLTMKQESTVNYEIVLKYMEITYILQRRDINEQMAIEDILGRWPFFGLKDTFEAHFYHLLDIKPDAVKQRAEEILPEWVKFFLYCSTQRRSGEYAKTPGLILERLQEHSKHPRAQATDSIAVFSCIMEHTGITGDKQKGIVLYFNDVTSRDEIEASENLPNTGKPVIAVCGKNPFLNPPCYVVVEKRCLSEKPMTLDTGISHLIMAYFTFKIEYELECAPVLEYYQRKVFKIDSATSRIGRKKSANGWGHGSEKISRKYSSMVSAFETWKNTYNII